MKFVFDGFVWDAPQRRLTLRYAMDGDAFSEVWQFDHDVVDGYSEPAFLAAAKGLWLVCGISYWKAKMPTEIVLNQGTLDAWQAQFFADVYQHGLAEFLYRNGLDVHTKITFPVDAEVEPKTLETTHGLGVLLPLGGGKDSLTSVALLQQNEIYFTTWTINATDLLQPQIDAIGAPHARVTRRLDPQLFALNAAGALNGHVPMSAMYGFAGVLSAILMRKKYVVLSNESSANHGNVVIDGVEVNHQWSKSLQFETMLQHYVARYVATDVHYFSLLRTLDEYSITQIFAAECWSKYRNVFTSCNKNFRLLNKSDKPQWCRACPKCAFVWGMLSAFVPPDELVAVFGANLYDDESMRPMFAALMGQTAAKPFECVGEPEEFCRALRLAQPKWAELSDWKIPHYAPKKGAKPHAVPDDFATTWNQQ